MKRFLAKNDKMLNPMLKLSSLILDVRNSLPIINPDLALIDSAVYPFI